MSSPLLRQAILLSHSRFILTLALDLIVSTYSQWSTQMGVVFSRPPGLPVSNDVSAPAITVVLCVKRVQVNDLAINVEAFRLELFFPGLMQTHPPFVFYCPRQILAPDYVRQTLEESLKEELAAWITRSPRVNSLMVEYVKNLQRKMRLLLSNLPVHAFTLNTTLDGPTITASFGSSRVSVVSTHSVKIVITTNDGYSISYECPHESVPSPATLQANLLQPYLAAV